MFGKLAVCRGSVLSLLVGLQCALVFSHNRAGCPVHCLELKGQQRILVVVACHFQFVGIVASDLVKLLSVLRSLESAGIGVSVTVTVTIVNITIVDVHVLRRSGDGNDKTIYSV